MEGGGTLKATLTICLSLVLSICHVVQGDYIVRIRKGLIQGYSKGQTVRFQGIPYATAQRFQYPSTDIPSWDHVKNTTSVGPQCYQLCSEPVSGLYCLPQMSEDCLTLNVYRPAYTLPPGQLFPVIVYIHGGDFSTGSGAAPVYDGDSMASRGRVIVVTFNYRLGSFGFLSIFDKYGGSVGNFGLRDQQTAIAWVRSNIAAFDGDPQRITLMGDGAGCVSIVNHLASPISKTMFNSAILQSCPLTIPFRNRTEARLQAEAFAEVIGCGVNDVTCYRSKSAEAVRTTQLSVRAERYTKNLLMPFYSWGPSIDNNEVFYHPIDVFKDLSRFSNKPIIIGTVADEGISFVYKRFPLPLSLDYFNSILESAAVSNTGTVPAGVSDMRDSLASIISDFVFSCPSVFVAKQVAKKQQETPVSMARYQPHDGQQNQQRLPHVWLYEYSEPQQMTSAVWTQFSSATDSICERRSCHGYDVRTLFSSDTLPLLERLKVEDLAKQMVRYWGNFARSDNVNGRITSLAHLRTLQLQTAIRSDNSGLFPWVRPRSQHINVQSLAAAHVGEGRQQVPRTQLQTALASFTYWPTYRTTFRGSGSTMLLQAPPLIIRRSYWQTRCERWNF